MKRVTGIGGVFFKAKDAPVVGSPPASSMFGILKRIFGSTTGSRAPLQPESQFVVRLSDSEVVCQRPDGQTERVAWDDLRRVEILTTPDGPFSPDAFWVLSGSDSGCVIPWGATGDRGLLEHLQRLPQFDNMAVINSAPKTEESMTLCWQKPI